MICMGSVGVRSRTTASPITRFQPHLVYGLPVLDRVQGGLDVRAGVQAHQVELGGLPVAGAVPGADLELHPEVRRRRPLEAVWHGRAEVHDPGHGHA